MMMMFLKLIIERSYQTNQLSTALQETSSVVLDIKI